MGSMSSMILAKDHEWYPKIWYAEVGADHNGDQSITVSEVGKALRLQLKYMLAGTDKVDAAAQKLWDALGFAGRASVSNAEFHKAAVIAYADDADVKKLLEQVAFAGTMKSREAYGRGFVYKKPAITGL